MATFPTSATRQTTVHPPNLEASFPGVCWSAAEHKLEYAPVDPVGFLLHEKVVLQVAKQRGKGSQKHHINRSQAGKRKKVKVIWSFNMCESHHAGVISKAIQSGQPSVPKRSKQFQGPMFHQRLQYTVMPPTISQSLFLGGCWEELQTLRGSISPRTAWRAFRLWLVEVEVEVGERSEGVESRKYHS